MTHTPEPWKVNPDIFGVTRIWASSEGEQCDVATPLGDGSISYEQQQANAARIVACINGCAGLNPAAYREVVTASQKILDLTWGQADRERFASLKQALAHAQESTNA